MVRLRRMQLGGSGAGVERLDDAHPPIRMIDAVEMFGRVTGPLVPYPLAQQHRLFLPREPVPAAAFRSSALQGGPERSKRTLGLPWPARLSRQGGGAFFRILPKECEEDRAKVVPFAVRT